jgi:long-chain acyl-CoA synthetase
VNLAEIIERHDASAVAFRFHGEDTTFGELRARCAGVRRWCAERGLEPGDRIALMLGATPEFGVAYFGVLGHGAIAVPLNPNSPAAELDRELRTVQASVVLAAAEAAASGTGVVGELRELGHEVFGVGEIDGSGTGAPDAPGAPDVSDVSEARAPLHDCDPDDPAAYLFTSGTAGSPKAAVLTHGSLLANIEQVELRVGLAATADDVGLLVVPPFHVLGLNAVLGVQMYVGGRLVLLERFDPAATLEAIRSEGVTILAGVPQLFAALADLPDATGEELASVRLACSGAAPLDAGTAERFEQRFGVPIWQGYGLTEASPTVTFPDLRRRRDVHSVGVPLPGVEVRVVDADGLDVEPGDPGEVLVRGPNVFAGYYEDPGATSAALDRRGWLHTGDVAVMADDGALTLVDRKKDLIIVSGFNVFPGEVEQVLTQCPEVEEAVVVGVPDEDQGESVRAFVVPDPALWPEGAAEPSGITPEDLMRHCSRHLARYKCPAQVTFVRELPRGLQGKVLRRAVG